MRNRVGQTPMGCQTVLVSTKAASHRDVNALDLTGVAADARRSLRQAAADNVKRVYLPRHDDWAADPGTRRLAAFVETKTVWHPIGV